MSTAPTPIKQTKQFEVTIGDEKPLFCLDDIIAINQSSEVIRRLQVPPNAPEAAGLKASTLPDHVKKCQTDVRQWDDVNNGILIGMSKLASDVEIFCRDSIQALDSLSEISSRIQREFDTMSDKQKAEARGEMNDIFSSLLETAQGKEKQCQAMATRLGNFAELLGQDSQTAETIRKNYAAYIAKEQQTIREWETKKGLKPSGDLIEDMKKRIEEINEVIRKKQNEALEKKALRVSGGTDTRWLPVLWLIPLAGVIAYSVVAAKNLPEAKALEEEVQGFLDQLKKYQQLNTLQIWFDAQKETFSKLITHLNAAKGAAENLRGQWQAFANHLSELLDDTGKLKGLKRDDWLEPLSKFKTKTARNVYEVALGRIIIFQTSAFRSQMPVEVVQPKAA
jgi:exonuclease VII large subunit